FENSPTPRARRAGPGALNRAAARTCASTVGPTAEKTESHLRVRRVLPSGENTAPILKLARLPHKTHNAMLHLKACVWLL
uniref:Uncharacterized protein n=1 Tax=Suricata suricatta TaxID=37032 RepID=A0A673UGN0_SURSU